MSLASISTRIRVGEIQSYLRDLNLLGLASALTLFLVIVFGFEHWITKIIANALFVAALVFPALLRHHLFWLILALSSSIALAADWYVSDNHKYLLVYWLWVMWISHLQPTREEAENVLRWHARFFLIFIFLVAAAQKFFSPTYMSGEMFELKLLLDGRFKAFGHLIGIDRAVSDEAMKLTLVLRSPLSEVEGDALILNSTDWTAQVAAEPFEVNADSANEGSIAEPGMVVVIDAANPGELKVASQAYDRKVAGIISGANDLAPGMVMSAVGNAITEGEHPVALTGRVWCWCDATDQSIEPGDMLTTSITPGHAMKALDLAAAQGAIIGKAMTPLALGDKGLVLVLVNLQ
jgi:hypothetical protein